MANRTRKTVRRQNTSLKKAIKREVKRDIKKMRPKQPRLRSKQPTGIGKALRGAGRLVGSYFGAPQLGMQAGAGISKIFGQGDYTVTSAAEIGPPQFGSLDGGFRVAHREYITDITSTTNFLTRPFALNPGVQTTFPWLSRIAKRFEEYEMKGLVVYLKTNSATAVASTNTALGVWGAVTQYDPSNPDFISKQQAENYVGCVNAVPCKNVLHAVECKPNANVLRRMYIRNEALTDIEDLKFYDLGKTEIFTAGSQSAATIGEMWISYDVVFYKPKIESALDDVAYFGATFENTTTTTPFTIDEYMPGSNMDITFPTQQRVRMGESLPSGLYEFRFFYSGFTAGTAANPTVANITNCTVTQGANAPQNGLSGTTTLFKQIIINKFPGVASFDVTTWPLLTNATGNVSVVYLPDTSIRRHKKKEQQQFTNEEYCKLKTLLEKFGPKKVIAEDDSDAESDSSKSQRHRDYTIIPELKRQNGVYKGTY